MSDPNTTDPAHAEWLERFGRRHGGVRAQDVQEVMSFEDEEAEPVQVAVHEGMPGIDPEQQIVNLMQQFRDGIQNYWQNYALGLENFVEAMQFSSEASAAPDYLQATLKSAAESALSAALGALPTPVAPLATIVGSIQSLAGAWAAESERAQAAAGEVRVRDYVASIRSGIPRQRDRMIAAITSGTRNLVRHFQQQATRDVGQGQATGSGHVVGDSARVLNSIQSGVQAFLRAIPSVRAFQQRFTSRFASREHHAPETGRLTGNLYTQMSVVVERGNPDRWSVRSVANAWTLVTDMPNPDRVAESLGSSNEGGVARIGLPKMVRLSVEIRGDDSQASPTGFIRFESNPARFTVRTNGSPDFLREAWQQSVVRQGIERIRRFEGASR